jgi:hypothetical protein
MRKLIDIVDTLTEGVDNEPWTPNWGSVNVYRTPTSISLYHATDLPNPRISTKKDRLIPNSISTTKRPDYVWGDKLYKFKIPSGTIVGELPSIFSILPDDAQDTPLNIGSILQRWAVANNIQILKIGRVGGVGTEWAILDPDLIKNFTRV